MLCTSFQNLNDDFPQSICKSCFDNLFAAYDFHSKCLNSQKQLLAVVSENSKNVLPTATKPIVQPNRNRHIEMLNRMYQCNVCSKYFRSFRGLRTHCRVHTGKLTNCKQCSMEFQNHAIYRRHIKFHNENICYNCNKGFGSELARKAHQSLHDTCTDLNSRFTCSICGTGYSSRLVLLRHLRSVHKEKTWVYFCGECVSVSVKENIFKDKTDLFKHLNECHQILDIQQKAKENNDGDIKSIKLCREDDIPAEFLNYNLLMDEDYSIRMVEEFLDDALLVSDSEHQSLMDPLDEVNDMQLGHEEIVEHQDMKPLDTPSKLSGCQNEHDLLKSRYKCPKCTQMFTQQIDLNLHLAHEHDEMVLVCNECGASFRKMSELELHRNEHKQENRIANESLSSFFRASRQHPNDKDDQHWLAIVTEEDSGNFKYMCKLCKKTYHRKFCIEQHNCPKNTSPNNKYHCAECNMSFAVLPEMLAHRKTHIADTLYCSLCDKKFTTIEGLKYHLKTHTGVKAFKCSYCHKTFTANVNLNTHIRTIHSEVKPHNCDFCFLSFATADHLRKHVSSIHLGLRKYACVLCDKQFLQQSHLTQHMWIHSGIKPHSCDFCSNTYTSKAALQKHVTKVHGHTL